LVTVVRFVPPGVGQLAEMERLPWPVVTRLADRLEAAGCVFRRANPEDRRAVLVTAAPRGTELCAAHERVANTWLARRLRVIGEADRLVLGRAVALRQALTQETCGAERHIKEDEKEQRN
jgi:DNA-binding MarR family transcriptional regulator